MDAKKFRASGYVQENVGAVITLIVGMGVAVLVLIFVGVLGGQTYQLTEDKITSISDGNIKADVQDSIKSGFEALKTSGDYLPIIVLAIVIFVVLGLVLSMTMYGGGRGYYGGAL